MRIMDTGDTVLYRGYFFQREYPVLLVLDAPKNQSDRFITEIDCEYNGHISAACIDLRYILHRKATNFYALSFFNPKAGIWTASYFGG